MNKTLKKQEKGFTIIEVLIVLAIAGLIVLVVFLAVPALQRNSRNTQRKNDVSGLVGAYNEYVNNNSGTVPADDAAFNSGVVPNAKASQYDIATDATTVYSKGTATGAVPTQTNIDLITIQTFAKCSGNNATRAGATARSTVMLYAVESGSSSSTQQCVEV